MARWSAIVGSGAGHRTPAARRRRSWATRHRTVHPSPRSQRSQRPADSGGPSRTDGRAGPFGDQIRDRWPFPPAQGRRTVRSVVIHGPHRLRSFARSKREASACGRARRLNPARRLRERSRDIDAGGPLSDADRWRFCGAMSEPGPDRDGGSDSCSEPHAAFPRDPVNATQCRTQRRADPHVKAGCSRHLCSEATSHAETEGDLDGTSDGHAETESHAEADGHTHTTTSRERGGPPRLTPER